MRTNVKNGAARGAKPETYARPPRGAFLPVSMEDVLARGWDGIEILIITGDAYVDHPSFGHAIIARWLEAHGFRVGVVSQPDWRGTEDLRSSGVRRSASCWRLGISTRC